MWQVVSLLLVGLILTLQILQFFLFLKFLLRCYLSADTHFIWALIAPVILIIFVNIFFFILVAKNNYYDNQQNANISKKNNACSWLKLDISIVVIMCLTWIPQILLLYRPELVLLAYTYAFMVAFQGVFILCILVLLSQPVRQVISRTCKMQAMK